MPAPPLRIAVPNKGSLAEPAAEMLHEAGYRGRSERRELVVVDEASSTELFFLRPRDIATYVGSGELDAGITGRDLLLDSGAAAEEVMPLGFARSTFRYAAQPGVATTLGGLDGLRVATSYPGLVGKHLADAGVDAQVIRLDGAVETSVRLGVADAIADVVETGSTLRQAGLEVLGEPILQSEAVLVRRAGSGGDPVAGDPVAGDPVARDRVAGSTGDHSRTDRVDGLVRRLRGVLVARSYVMVDYDIPTRHVDAACRVTPGIESPTVSPLLREDWSAVRAMVPRAGHQAVMDELWDLGARGILVTDIHACRL